MRQYTRCDHYLFVWRGFIEFEQRPYHSQLAQRTVVFLIWGVSDPWRKRIDAMPRFDRSGIDRFSTQKHRDGGVTHALRYGHKPNLLYVATLPCLNVDILVSEIDL